MPPSIETLSWHAMARRGLDPAYWHGPMHEWDDYQQTLFFNEFSNEFQQWLSARELSEIETMKSQQWLHEAQVEDQIAPVLPVAESLFLVEHDSDGGHEMSYKDAAYEMTENLWSRFNLHHSQTALPDLSKLDLAPLPSPAPADVLMTTGVQQAEEQQQSSLMNAGIAQHLTNALERSASPRLKMCQCPSCRHTPAKPTNGQTVEESGRATIVKPLYAWAPIQHDTASPRLSARAPMFQALSPPKQEVRASAPIFRPAAPSKQEVHAGAPVFCPSSPAEQNVHAGAAIFSSVRPVYNPPLPDWVPSSAASKRSSPVSNPTSPAWNPTSDTSRPSSAVFNPTSPAYNSSSSTKQEAHGHEHLGNPPAADLMFDYIRRNKEHLRKVFKDSQTNMGKVIRASLKLIDEEDKTTK